MSTFGALAENATRLRCEAFSFAAESVRPKLHKLGAMLLTASPNEGDIVAALEGIETVLDGFGISIATVMSIKDVRFIADN